MADKKYVNDINEILDFVLNDDSDLDVDLGNDTDDFSNTDSEWEFESDTEVTNKDISNSFQHENNSVHEENDQQQEEMNIDPQVQSSPSVETCTTEEEYESTSSDEESEQSQTQLLQQGDSTKRNDQEVAPNVGRKRIRTRGGYIQRPTTNQPVVLPVNREEVPPVNFEEDNNAQRARGVNNRNNRGRVRGRGGRGHGHGRGRGHPEQRQGHVDNTWQWNMENETNDEFQGNIFMENVGLRVRMQNNKTNPIDFVNLYLTDDMYELIVRETNRYARQHIEDNPQLENDSYTGLWKDVTVIEIKKFIGVILLMGIIHKPSIPMYWSTTDIFYTPVFSKIMTRTRFQLLLKFLHFNDNQDPNYDPNSDDRDRLHKLRPLIELIRQQCKNVFYPGRNLSVDESLVLFKGRLHFKQYIRTKRARFGIKLYELCTSEGITLDFLIYCGKGMFYDDDNSDLPSTERIPFVLMEQYLNKNHVLFTDNFYTSPTLAKLFLENGTYLCGTVRSNRKHFCKDLVSVQLEKGNAAFYRSVNEPNILLAKYRSIKDKAGNQEKIVYVLSTCHTSKMIDTGKKGKNGETVYKPSIVTDYNSHMGGVDKVDQQLNGLHTLRKSYKWYKKLAFRLISQIILNAHKIYQMETGKNEVTFLQFLQEVIVSLVTVNENVELDIRMPIDETVERLTGRHFPSLKIAPPGAKDQRPSKRCRVCYARGIRSDKGHPLKTVYICRFCPSEPGLHPEKCFEDYHTKVDYTNVD